MTFIPAPTPARTPHDPAERALRIINARIVTCSSTAGPIRGRAMDTLRVLERGEILCEQGLIARVRETPTGPPRPAQAPTGPERVLDVGGRVVLPGLIDCHTHLCSAGSRIDEWEMQLAGTPYLDMLLRGGGIMSTVRAVRAASRHELRDALSTRLARCLAQGVTPVEVKSGYGLTTHDELKMLRAIDDVRALFPGTIISTALLGHAIDPEQPDFVRRTIDETLPAVHAEFPRIAIDAFCEQGAWTLHDCIELFERAGALGHPRRVHADQFHALGMTPHAASKRFASVDHLEASREEDLRTLAGTSTVGVVLPAVGLHGQNTYANARTIIDAGGAAAIASNANPGSAPGASMMLAIAAGVRKCGFTPREAITASTWNAACVLGLPDRGAIMEGLRADLLVLESSDERSLSHDLSGTPLWKVLVGGRESV